MLGISTSENIKKTRAFFVNEIDNFLENFKTFDKSIKDFITNVSREKNFSEQTSPFQIFPSQVIEKTKNSPEQKGFHYALYLHIKNQLSKKDVAFTTTLTFGYEEQEFESFMNTYTERLKKYNVEDEPYTMLKYDLER